MKPYTIALFITTFTSVPLANVALANRPAADTAQNNTPTSPSPAPGVSTARAPNATARHTGAKRRAQSLNDPLAAAEAAYAEIDLETAGAQAERALVRGGHTPEQTRRIHFLRGVVRAAMGERQAARDAFVRVLLLDPEVKLQHALAPRLRIPYMEARALAAGKGRFGAQARLHTASGRLVLSLSDPLGFASQIRLRVRSAAERPFTTHALEPVPERAVKVAGLQRFGYAEYVLEVLDEHGNVLWAEGTELAPVSLGTPHGWTSSSQDDGPSAVPYYVTAGIMGALGAVSLGVGVPFHVEYNDRKRELGGSACQPTTDGYDPMHCDELAEEKDELNALRLIAFGIGAGLLAGGLTALVLAPGREQRTGVAAARACTVQAGPTLAALHCHARF